MCNENTNDPFTLCSNYISGNFLVFRKLEKNKPKQPENLSCFGFGTIWIITTFTKINVLPQMFLCFIIGQMVPLMVTLYIRLFAFSENSIIRFSENEFSWKCTVHYSVKVHVLIKIILQVPLLFLSLRLQWSLCSFFSKSDYYIFMDFSFQQFSIRFSLHNL